MYGNAVDLIEQVQMVVVQILNYKTAFIVGDTGTKYVWTNE